MHQVFQGYRTSVPGKVHGRVLFSLQLQYLRRSSKQLVLSQLETDLEVAHFSKFGGTNKCRKLHFSQICEVCQGGLLPLLRYKGTGAKFRGLPTLNLRLQ